MILILFEIIMIMSYHNQSEEFKLFDNETNGDLLLCSYVNCDIKYWSSEIVAMF